MRVQVVGLLLALTFSPAAAATVRCGPYEDVLRWLDAKFSEVPLGSCMISGPQRQLVEVLVSNSGTWSIIVTSPQGRSCIVMYGDNWSASTKRVDSRPAR